MEYGYSCMGYEIAGGLGVKMAQPEREVVVMVGDGSYLMLNSEIATSVMLGMKLVVVVLDNRGYRLHQPAAAGVRRRAVQQPVRRLRAGRARRAARSTSRRMRVALGARAEHVADDRRAGGGAGARARVRPHVRRSASTPIPRARPTEGGWWWEVAVPEVSTRAKVRAAREQYEHERTKQRP